MSTEESTEEQWTFTGAEGLSRLIHIFIAGYTSGVATAVANFTPLSPGPLSAKMVAVLRHDPAGMLAVEEQLRCFLAGGEPEDQVLKLYGRGS